MIKAELFNAERLEEHARALARAQPVSVMRGQSRSLMERVHDNNRLLTEANRTLLTAHGNGEQATPAAQWMIDNFHVVRVQTKEILVDLPPGYYRQLPKVATGPLAGYPRVFGISWDYVAHTDSDFEPDTLRRFIRAYQETQPLTIGEIWAVAITLRIVLVENLRRAANRILENRQQREKANALADTILDSAHANANDLPDILRKCGEDTLNQTFAVQLIKRLRDQSPAVTPTLLWLEECLARQGTSADEIVRQVHQNQAAMTVTVRNIVTSMRMMSAVDWRDLFEAMSPVDDLLRQGESFTRMDFPTRDMYRKAIEDLALGSGLPELAITREVMQAAEKQKTIAHSDLVTAMRAEEPGFYLIGGGRPAFEKAIGYRPRLRLWFRQAIMALGLKGQIGAVMLLTLMMVALVIQALANLGLGTGGLIGFGLLSVFPALDVAWALTNTAITSSLPPALIPAMDFRDGIASESRTMVVVPALLTSPSSMTELIDRLEIHYLSSPKGEVYFALLTDWTDAVTETAPDDQMLLGLAREGIGQLNQRYGMVEDRPRFYLMHRRRLWNPSERRWIGWERKRGKLHELNRLLRGATDTTFIAGSGAALLVPPDVRYVITLDSDTQLPRETVACLIGKMAHPLNRPRFGPDGQTVVDGYGILQPRVTPSLPLGTEPSLYQYAFSAPAGIDPYVSAVSEVYQDLLGEGSYAGKGIYDVDAFEQALDGRIPENTLLSHDLFEGTFARSGFASDVEVIEEFPARHDISASRQHRWTRGDWQLLPWILGQAGTKLPAAGRWKMLDNLRRGLTPPLLIIAFLSGFALTSPQAAWWTEFLLVTIMAPYMLPLFTAIVPRGRDMPFAVHLHGFLRDVRLAATQAGLVLALLAEHAVQTTDAITRTLVRLYVTRRDLLEWTTFEQARSGAKGTVWHHYLRMRGTVALGFLTLLIGILAKPGVTLLATPLGLLWLLAPFIAWRVSQSAMSSDNRPVLPEDRRALRMIARRTWRYFERYVTAEDNMLPPDNFQEDPRPVIAHRTSPTNIGLYLLSVAAARDFGWIGLHDAVDRLEATLATLNRMERLNGHFYNWYDTTDLRPLIPRYISSVDSGNLAGHLIVLANACREWTAAPLTDARLASGITDSIAIIREILLQPELFSLNGENAPLPDLLTRIEQHLTIRDEPVAHTKTLLDLAGQAVAAARLERTAHPDMENETLIAWTEALEKTIAGHLRDMALLPPLTGAMMPEDTETALNALSAQTDQTLPCSAGRRASAVSLSRRLHDIASRVMTLSDEMRFDFLIDPDRHLLSIGYRASDNHLDQSSYDLLASEARLASFLAIARGELPVSHWFRLGRSVTAVNRGAVLISWSGSMFEYLMPSLVMRAPTGSLLATTNRLAVWRQIAYANLLGIPWGMSESAYNTRDFDMTYQYSNFGIPDLALKRGLGESAVIAPYATGLASMVDPGAAVLNYTRLRALGALGAFGFYEALDYTPSRVPVGQTVAIVRAYMAHHQGMTILAILNTVLDGVMRARFHAEPRMRAAELLLQERAPTQISGERDKAAVTPVSAAGEELDYSVSRRLSSPHGTTPATHILSNGRYSVMITAAGSGYSRWRGRAITRWREDVTRDNWGSYLYLRDVETDLIWSAGYHPTGREADHYTVTFAEERVEITRRDDALVTNLEIVVSAEDDAEVRRVTLTNTGLTAREIELTSYMELALALPADDLAHPAFSKMFIQTEFRSDLGAVLAWRRSRSASEAQIWAAHLIVVEGEAIGDLHAETDRAAFLGRGRTARDPIAMEQGRPLSGTTGTVLDPIFSLRQRVRVAPGATTRVAFWTMAADNKPDLLRLIDSHHDKASFQRAVTLAWTQARVQMHHLEIGSAEANDFQRLASHLLYVNGALRPPANVIERGAGGQAGLWAHGISGDLPIMVVRIDDTYDIAFVRELVLAHEYWRMKQLATDLVILNEKATSYHQDVQAAIDDTVRMGQTRLALAGEPLLGHVFVLSQDSMTPEARDLLLSVARVVFISRRGRLADQLERLEDQKIAASPSTRPFSMHPPEMPEPPPPHLEFFNGWGGFAEDGREYVTLLHSGRMTPAPWTNVIANAAFGFQITAEGGGYSWWRNSRENQLTPWSNDPVTDQPGDILYVRDDDSGDLWGPCALPMRLPGARFEVRHGMGYSRFRSLNFGIETNLTQFVPLEDSVRIARLVVRNTSGQRRRLSVTSYVEWVLGPSRSGALTSIVTDFDPKTQAIFARNPWNTAFGDYTAFQAMPGRDVEASGDRRAFLGRNGTFASPAALTSGGTISGQVGAGLDPCGVLRTRFLLAPGESTEIIILLGAAGSKEDAIALIKRQHAANPDDVLARVRQYWDEVTGAVQVSTPDRTLDLMLNRWLLYQTLACRVWARSGFYQASGAFGFRDQLQDGMALAATMPALTRGHLLRAAARQFLEGDVQHWWLPPGGQGIRTRISDDRIWLAYAAHQYVSVSSDSTVLDESIPFLSGPLLPEHEQESYFHPEISSTTATLFEHCALGLDHALATGAHGLPLIGTGDWNDGMSRVGVGGKGESVWLGWFLHTTLLLFAPVAEARGETTRASSWRDHAAKLKTALEDNAWDGAWYRRGYFDDGTPLGSATSSECRIDSIAQSWAVISGAADPARAARAMAALEEQLIRRHDGLALLLTPPFDHTSLDPGYIKGYPPGIRENGGQYTHAGIWALIAFALQGNGDKATGLFWMMNPVNHALTSADAYRYKVEPYVLAADIYSAPGHVGRGGWTWYTGSAGWMYRAGIEYILGIRREGRFLTLDPCVPRTWPRFSARVRHGGTFYEISVENPDNAGHGVREAELDGQPLPGRPVRFEMHDDGVTHGVRLVLG